MKKKWDAIRSKISDSNCDIICLQETKNEFFDKQYIKNFCPIKFDSFEYLPSNGASGGSIIIWNSSKFVGNPVFQNSFALSVEFQRVLSGENWILTNVYAPCTPQGKVEFLRWFKNIDMSDGIKWLIVGDFNLLRVSSKQKQTGRESTRNVQIQ